MSRNPPSAIPQADDGDPFARIRLRNMKRMREWRDAHHGDGHSCSLTHGKKCLFCGGAS